MKFTGWHSERRASRDADDLKLGPSSNFSSEAPSYDSDAWSASEDAESGLPANQSKKAGRPHYHDNDLGLDVSEAKSWRRIILVIVYLKTLSTVSLKWLVAVMLRKIFVWLEETFTGGSSLFGLSTSRFWNAVFLKTVSFYTLIGYSMGPIVMIALGTGIIRALPVRLVGVYARARRARLVEIALTTMALTEMNVDANYLLEQVSLLNEYESHVQAHRLDSVVRIVVVTIFCFVLFWQATVFTVLLFAITILLRFSLQDRLPQEPYRRRAEITSKIHTSIDDVLRGADAVATHNMEWREMHALAAKKAPGIMIDRQIWRILFILGFPELFALGLMLPGVVLLARLMFDNTDSVSDAINTLFALTAMFFVFDEGHKGIVALILTSSQAQSYKQSLGIVNEVLAAVPPRQRLRESLKKDGGHDSEMERDPIVPGSLVFENVTVQYPRTSAPAVRDISFTIPQGLTMAIVAESGGRKSTLFRVALALVRHQSGNVFYGNAPLNDLTKHAIRKHMGFVSQDSMLFARTIRENIWYGNVGEPDDSVIWSVLENLGLETWVRSLKAGLGTIVETERMVSGGQAQRLQIARLLCRQDVYYVLLDECMSALDPVMRATVTQALKVFLRGKTAMVITHSHDTVSDLCDKVLDLGILAQGRGRAIQSAHEYITGLSRGARVKSAAWNAIFNRMAT